MPGRVPQIHFSLFFATKRTKDVEGRALSVNGILYGARSLLLVAMETHAFSTCRKRSSFDWLCTPVLCPTTGFGVTTDCSKHPEKPSLSVVGCSGGDRFCDLADGLVCEVFRRMTEDERWDTAKQAAVCFRSLGCGHHGYKCKRSRSCRIDRCRDDYHRLLDPSTVISSARPPRTVETTTALSSTSVSSPVKNSSVASHLPQEVESSTMQTLLTSGEQRQRHQHTAVALRTVPIVLTNGDRSVQVNALLDDESTQSYINADVAAELGLQGPMERVQVNVLNGNLDADGNAFVQSGWNRED